MKKICINLCILFFAVLTAQSVYAQETSEEVKKELHAELYAFAKAYSNLSESKDKNTVLKYVSKNLTSTLIKYDVRDRVIVLNQDYYDFESYLNKIVRASKLDISYEVTDILKTYVKDKFGYVVYSVAYEIKQDGSVWSKGEETISMTFHSVDKQWKMLYFTVLNVEDEKEKGACLCEFFKSDTDATSTNYVVKTTVPSGKTYSTYMNTFEFMKKGGRRTIEVDHKLYIWEEDGDVLFADEGKEPVKVTKAHPDDDIDVIVEIIKGHLYSSNCTNVKLKK